MPRWTAVEKTTVREAVVAGMTQGDIQKAGLLPGRNIIAIQNMVNSARCTILNVCLACRRAPPAEGFPLCEGCQKKRAERSRARLQKLNASGLCQQCGKRPPEARVTRCTPCTEKIRTYNPPSKGGHGSHTLLRWTQASHPHALVALLPDDGELLLDVFGGALGTTAALHRRFPDTPIVYNDIHPDLHNFLRCVRGGTAGKILRLANDLSDGGDPAALVDLYDNREQLFPEARAAVFHTMAKSVLKRNMWRRNLNRVHPPVGNFPTSAERLQRLLMTLTLHQSDFTEVIQRYGYDGPGTVLLLDPPFPGPRGFEHTLTKPQWRQLIALLQTVSCRYIITLGSTRQALEIAAQLPHVYWRKMSSATAATGGWREILASNYPVQAANLEPVDPARFGIT